MVPDQPEREGRLHDQLLELESVRSAGLLTAAEHKSKREAVISRWEESLRQREESEARILRQREESQARILRQREVIETTLAENKAKTQQLLHALRATVKHGSDLLSTKQMEGVRQAYLELTGLGSAVAASRPSGEPSGTRRRAEDALDIDRETLGSLPDQPLDDLEDSGAPAPAPVTPDEVPPAPTEEEEPQEPEEKARRREWEAAKGIAAVAGVGGTGAAGIVPKRPRRERKAPPNPYVPVDFRPEPKCHNSGLGCSRCRFSKSGCATCKARKSAARGLMLQALMKEGLMEPGQEVLRVEYRGHVFLGDLTPSGSICYEGKLWESPSPWSLHVKRRVFPGKMADDGWDSVFYVTEDGEKTNLHQLRSRSQSIC
ncbi:MPN domain-containing protein [Chloropicon roscoffensis]|uniref:MPN domain-containing protein n=1 Tax=Chloropicon roscoffensis TaxID=1461544 RepID=A0AAX4PBW5_9CHLO